MQQRKTLKQARVLFHLPDSHSMDVCEGRGRTSEPLRKAIRAAEKTFNRVYDAEMEKWKMALVIGDPVR